MISEVFDSYTAVGDNSSSNNKGAGKGVSDDSRLMGTGERERGEKGPPEEGDGGENIGGMSTSTPFISGFSTSLSLFCNHSEVLRTYVAQKERQGQQSQRHQSALKTSGETSAIIGGLGLGIGIGKKLGLGKYFDFVGLGTGNAEEGEKGEKVGTTDSHLISHKISSHKRVMGVRAEVYTALQIHEMDLLAETLQQEKRVSLTFRHSSDWFLTGVLVYWWYLVSCGVMH